MAVQGRPSLRGENIASDFSASAAALLEHFVDRSDRAARWPEETIEIEASLSKLKKTGRLSAIRRLLPAGHPESQALWVAGDSTAKEVIGRYVSADARAKELPASSALPSLQRTTRSVMSARCCLQMGLRAHSGSYPGISGRASSTVFCGWMARRAWPYASRRYLSKVPSIFLKRVNLTRANELRAGAVAAWNTPTPWCKDSCRTVGAYCWRMVGVSVCGAPDADPR
jgi:hypothetical protein